MPTEQCGCGIPNRANWHTNVILGRDVDGGTETTYTDIYSCEDHFPGYPDGSQTDADVRSMLRFDNSEQWEILESKSTHLR